MHIIKKNYENVGHSLPRVYEPRKVAKLREAQASRERDPQKREALLASAREWRASKKVWHKTTREGKPIFESRRDVEEFQAKTGRRFQWDTPTD